MKHQRAWALLNIPKWPRVGGGVGVGWGWGRGDGWDNCQSCSIYDACAPRPTRGWRAPATLVLRTPSTRTWGVACQQLKRAASTPMPQGTKQAWQLSHNIC